jgi:hypothetical protein
MTCHILKQLFGTNVSIFIALLISDHKQMKNIDLEYLSWLFSRLRKKEFWSFFVLRGFLFICFVESLKIFCFDTFFVRLLLNPSRLFVHEGCLVENMLFGFCWNSPMKQITLELTSNSIYIRVEKKTKTSSYPERVVYYTMLTVKIFFYDPFFTVAF